jgi:hypothetical protein
MEQFGFSEWQIELPGLRWVQRRILRLFKESIRDLPHDFVAVGFKSIRNPFLRG